jgi:hypothetical protein
VKLAPSIGICLAAGLGVVVATSCEDPDDGRGNEGFCGTLEGYVSMCGDLSACENAIIRDCADLELAVTPTFAEATADCMRSLGAPKQCLADAAGVTPSSADVEMFAETLCLECGSGAGSCAQDVIAGTSDDPLARAGRLARVLAPSVLEAVTTECATGAGCAESFEACARTVVARSLPGETVDCLVSAVLDGDTGDGCGGTSGADTIAGTDSMGTGGTSTTASSTTGVDPTGDTGSCTSEGCACMFTEDCDAGLVCLGDVCTAEQQCEPDPNEPNGGENQATVLPGIGDSDGDGSTVMGQLAGASDYDWFVYTGSDNFGSVVNPYGGVNVNALELCLHFECLSGLENTTVACPMGTTQQPSPGGRPGCCATNTTGFELDISGCSTGGLGDDSGYVYMRVGGAEAGVCQDFTLSYHF